VRLLCSVLLLLALAAPVLAPGQQPSPSASPSKAQANPPQANPADDKQPKRLILKDGSYQQTIRWERKGNRIRYLSAERYEWEEIPESLIDWPATEKYQRDGPSTDSPEAKAADAEEEADRQAEEANEPEVAPGLRLPNSGGVYLFDQFNGRPELVELSQNGGQVNNNRGKNILRAAINPLAKAKQTIDLKGMHASVQSHLTSPVIYLNVDPDPDSGSKATPRNFRIVRCQPGKDTRTVETIEVAMWGKVTQKRDAIQTQSEPLNPVWVKLTAAAPLTPGEYAIVEVLGQDINMYVWDFGVNPSAPDNPSAWKPGATAPKQPAAASPALTPRKKDNNP